MARPKTTDTTIKVKVTFSQLDKLKRAADSNGVKMAEVLRKELDKL